MPSVEVLGVSLFAFALLKLRLFERGLSGLLVWGWNELRCCRKRPLMALISLKLVQNEPPYYRPISNMTRSFDSISGLVLGLTNAMVTNFHIETFQQELGPPYIRHRNGLIFS